MQKKLLGIINVDFDAISATDRIFCICQILGKKRDTVKQCIRSL